MNVINLNYQFIYLFNIGLILNDYKTVAFRLLISGEIMALHKVISEKMDPHAFKNKMLERMTVVRESIFSIQLESQALKDSLDYNSKIREALSKSIEQRNALRKTESQLRIDLDVRQKELENALQSAEAFRKMSENLQKTDENSFERKPIFRKGSFKLRDGAAKVLDRVRFEVETIKRDRDKMQVELSLWKIKTKKEMASWVDKMKVRFSEIIKERDEERVEKQLAQAEEVRLLGELEMMTRRTRKKTIQVEQAEKIKDNFMELIHSGHYGSSKEVIA